MISIKIKKEELTINVDKTPDPVDLNKSFQKSFLNFKLLFISIESDIIFGKLNRYNLRSINYMMDEYKRSTYNMIYDLLFLYFINTIRIKQNKKFKRKINKKNDLTKYVSFQMYYIYIIQKNGYIVN